MNNAVSTSDLFTATHAALCAGKFSQAVSLLDNLGRRDDNRDSLASAKAYSVPAHLEAIIQDRIDLVHAKADGR
jgi:hypothetical protein